MNLVNHWYGRKKSVGDETDTWSTPTSKCSDIDMEYSCWKWSLIVVEALLLAWHGRENKVSHQGS